MANLIPASETVRLLRIGTPDNHPFVAESSDADAKGAAYNTFTQAAADLVEASAKLEDGVAFASGVALAVYSLLQITEGGDE